MGGTSCSFRFVLWNDGGLRSSEIDPTFDFLTVRRLAARGVSSTTSDTRIRIGVLDVGVKSSVPGESHNFDWREGVKANSTEGESCGERRAASFSVAGWSGVASVMHDPNDDALDKI